MSRTAAANRHPDDADRGAGTQPPVQLTLPDAGPLACDGPAGDTLADERRAAIAASHRLLDAIEQRAHTQADIRDVDRQAALADVARRRRQLEQETVRYVHNNS